MPRQLCVYETRQTRTLLVRRIRLKESRCILLPISSRAGTPRRLPYELAGCAEKLLQDLGAQAESLALARF